ncbi:MAG: mucoidy inhibitor MuiA family protein [Planctomycetales bacterium]
MFHSMRTSVRGLAAWCLMSTVAAAAHSAETAGKVSEVTLYRGQALVTRTVEVAGPAGPIEVVVTGLPVHVGEDSLFAEGGPNVEIRAVRYRARAVGEEPREEVRQLDDAIAEVRVKIEAVASGQALLKQRSAYLDKLDAFVVPTVQGDLGRGVLDATALEKMTALSFTRREEIAKETLALDKQSRELARELSLLERQRAELASGSSRTQREAVLFVQKHGDAQEAVRLSYLVANCGWSPTYTLRAREPHEKVLVEYSALIHQASGEDWSGVSLVLSTASPALSAAGPGIAPFRVTLAADSGKQQPMGQEALQSELQRLSQGQQSAYSQNRMSRDLRENIGSSWTLNEFAGNRQALELQADKSSIEALRAGTAELEDGPSLSYPLPGTVSLASRSDQQMVRILQKDFPSKFYHVATPLLTSYVYRQAELTNDSDQDLLAGPVTIYLDGRFVGRGEVPTVARGQGFVAGFGVDPQLRTRRELAEKSESTQGGNRELKLAYRLVVENFKQEAVKLRVVDRLPASERTADVRVTLHAPSDPLSADKLYLQRERPLGILRWEIEVPAGARGGEARQVEYSFTIEHDRNFQLASPDDQQRLQREFERLQMEIPKL